MQKKVMRYKGLFVLFQIFCMVIFASASESVHIYAEDASHVIIESTSKFATYSFENSYNRTTSNYSVKTCGDASENHDVEFVEFVNRVYSGESHEVLSLRLANPLSDGSVVKVSYSFYVISTTGDDYILEGDENIKVTLIPERPAVPGRPVVWGDPSKVSLDVSNEKDVVKVVAGKDFTAFLNPDGTVSIVGPECYAQSGNWKNVVDLEGNGTVLCGLTSEGNVYVAGDTSQIDGLELIDGKIAKREHIISVSCSSNRIVFATSDGRIHTANVNYQESLFSELHDVVKIFAGEKFTAALSLDGVLYYALDAETSWGMIPNVACASAGSNHLVYLTKDKEINIWGNWSKSWNLDDLEGVDAKNVKMISAGRTHTLYLQENRVLAKGIANQPWVQDFTPQNNAKIIQIAAGQYHSVALIGAEEPETENLPPQIIGETSRIVITENINTNLSTLLNWSFIDPEGDTLRYSLENAPDGMKINEFSGVIMWQPPSDCAGRAYSVKLAVTDEIREGKPVGIHEVVKEFTVTVLPTSYPPQLTLVDKKFVRGEPLHLSLVEGDELKLIITVTDADFPNDSLKLVMSNAPDGMFLNILMPEQNRAIIEWVPEKQQAGNEYVIVFSVSDSKGESDTATLVIQVLPKEEEVFEPEYETLPDGTQTITWKLEEGQKYRLYTKDGNALEEIYLAGGTLYFNDLPLEGRGSVFCLSVSGKRPTLLWNCQNKKLDLMWNVQTASNFELLRREVSGGTDDWTTYLTLDSATGKITCFGESVLVEKE